MSVTAAKGFRAAGIEAGIKASGGPDLALLGQVVGATRQPVTYSGGVASLADLRAVADAGASSVILGRSLLEGLIPLAAALAHT